MCVISQNPIPSLYLHIPFCARRCPYCDFAVSVNKKAEFRAAYLRALKTEIDTLLRADEFDLQTIFCGGGTPTELSPADLNELLDFIAARAPVSENAEISLEANPENLAREDLEELRAGGWNRLSLGVQSFDATTLARFGRAHSPQKALETLENARAAGFSQISLDLIYGEPFTSPENWKKTLEIAAQSGATHISAYSLTIEGGTQFSLQVGRGEFCAPDDDSQAHLMDLAQEILGAAGFARYEVSNWAKPGFESRHNSNYWRGGDYGAVGCGAHGHRAGHRFWNERDAKIYVHRLENGASARAGEEFLTPEQRFNELVALGLRTSDGFDLENAGNLSGFGAGDDFWQNARFLEKNGALEIVGTRFRAQTSFLALADGLAARLLS